jgi:enoyl-CoA hydratase
MTEKKDTPEFILYETPAHHVARILLNRPAARNAQNTQLLYELNDAFDRAAKDDDIKVVILASTGKDFSAGHDLHEHPRSVDMKQYRTVGTSCGFACAGAEAQYDREKEIYLGFSERWRNFAKPTIAAVQGKCIAGGLMLVWPCDIIIAAENAKFGQPEINLGILPGAGGTQRLPRAVGKAKAMDLCLTARMMDATEAERCGLVSRVVPLDKLLDEAHAVAEKIAGFSTPVAMMIKESVNRAWESSLTEGILFERRVFHANFALADQKEGMSAFTEKRKPSFRNR